jgi:mRNA interferase MazF
VRQYEIWWADLPQPAGRRPVLLLTRDDAYSYLSKFIIAEITTVIRSIPTEVLLGKNEGLPKACVANFDNLRSLSRSALIERIAPLPRNRVAEVKRAVGYAFGWSELTELNR